jgi:hypothetical protein
MGMFDSVYVECPKCQQPVEIQSKAGECFCNSYKLDNAPNEILCDIMNEPEYCRSCGNWLVLVDPRFPPGCKPHPDLRVVSVKPPPNPDTHPQGFKWWPGNHPFTYTDLEEPIS